MVTSTNIHTEVSIICDSGANDHMISWREDTRNTRTVNRGSTFENKGKLQALTLGYISLRVNARGTEAPVKGILKDEFWVPGLPRRLLPTGIIRRDGGKLWAPVERIRAGEWQTCGVGALTQCHDILKHIDLATVKHLEKRGLVAVTDTTESSYERGGGGYFGQLLA